VCHDEDEKREPPEFGWEELHMLVTCELVRMKTGKWRGSDSVNFAAGCLVGEVGMTLAEIAWHICEALWFSKRLPPTITSPRQAFEFLRAPRRSQSGKVFPGFIEAAYLDLTRKKMHGERLMAGQRESQHGSAADAERAGTIGEQKRRNAERLATAHLLEWYVVARLDVLRLVRATNDERLIALAESIFTETGIQKADQRGLARAFNVSDSTITHLKDDLKKIVIAADARLGSLFPSKPKKKR
jgi:hypothetical protein